MSGADRVVVNSSFTRRVVRGVWPALEGELGVVYPCVDTTAREDGGIEGQEEMWKGKKVLLSINRFERKKNVELALRAFARLGEKQREGVRLVVAGLSSPPLRPRPGGGAFLSP